MTSKPLEGKTILVTRAKEQAQQLTHLLKEQGGTVIEVPLIAFKPVSSNEMKSVIHTLEDYQWLVFTSANGVRFFMEEVKRLEKSIPPHSIKIAVVGTKTNEVLKHYHLEADLIPEDFVAEGLIQALAGQIKRGDRILIARGNLGRKILVEQLTELGAYVHDLPVYETVVPEDAQDELISVLNTRQVDYVTFTSSSTVDHFSEIVRGSQCKTDFKVACIGPIATRTAMKNGLTVDLTPHTYTIDHLVEQIINDAKGV
ncbi:uroporphyrinogen-III synthase [Halalkalibacter krulwichiae]|uniref:Uroporphyrinogen-III synthase n=1 Tax=Halalkalibacter krulwichiae TaxID=199441 RepID=A0A1X9MDU2_9BACI|nr:uroporphyrinogen-III synthase [Halalkalibacter krulwichiae]ARK31619.1 Uroporphyrinogen-III synthase [Halalkalibacter krulwichiae]